MESNNNLLQSLGVRRGVTAVLIFLALFLAVITISEFKGLRFVGGGVPVTNTVTVLGEGEVFAVPDLATFTFSVIEERDSAPEAQEIAAEKVNKIIALLKESGVDEKDIKTVNYNLFPRYEFRRAGGNSQFFPGTGTRELIGFEVSQTIQVKVRDTGDAGTLLSNVGTLGASNVSGLTFTVDDEGALKREARKMAIDDAEEKAKQLANDLSVRLVRVVSFSESGGQPYFARSSFDQAFTLEAVGGAVSPEIPVGENKISSNVSITYEIR